nr:pyridoxal 5'-phosphate synthase glutaminase subunit PdxT [Prevotella sp.]
MKIAVLALQGAFAEHEKMLSSLGVEYFEVRQLSDWQQEKDGLIIPGGESTVQLKLLKELGLLMPIREAIEKGLPVFGTCAGLILLAKHVEGEDYDHLSTMDITVKRNAYGRQLGSFHTEGKFGDSDNVPMTFIRAPYIENVESNTEVLSVVEGKIVAARQGKQLVTAFHPELDNDKYVYEYWINMI